MRATRQQQISHPPMPRSLSARLMATAADEGCPSDWSDSTGKHTPSQSLTSSAASHTIAIYLLISRRDGHTHIRGRRVKFALRMFASAKSQGSRQASRDPVTVVPPLPLPLSTNCSYKRSRRRPNSLGENFNVSSNPFRLLIKNAVSISNCGSKHPCSATHVQPYLGTFPQILTHSTGVAVGVTRIRLRDRRRAPRHHETFLSTPFSFTLNRRHGTARPAGVQQHPALYAPGTPEYYVVSCLSARWAFRQIDRVYSRLSKSRLDL